MLLPEHGITAPYAIIQKRKFDGRVKSEWEGDLLPWLSAEWLVVLHHPDRHVKVTNGVVESSDHLFLHCLNTIHPLTVLIEYYDLGGKFKGAKCDAALPATKMGSVIAFVDLDLDVIVKANLAYSVRDEEAFSQRRVTMAYTQSVIQQAHHGIKLGQSLVASRSFPFDERFIPRFEISLATKAITVQNH